VRRTFAALTALLGSDEDMATMYLSHAAAEGEQRAIDDHAEVEIMLEAFATQLEDLLDRVGGLRETVATHRTLEGLELQNERNRIMRLELLLAMGMTSMAVSATVASVFGMNLTSGLEEGHTHLFWGVAGCCAFSSAALMSALLAGLNRFRSAQRHHVQQSASLERTLTLLDSAYYALRRTGALAGHDALVRGERAVSGASAPSTGLRFEELRAAVAETPCLQRGVTDADLMSLWEVFDANSDGVLDRDELPSMYDPAGPDHWSAEPNRRQGGKAGKAGDEG